MRAALSSASAGSLAACLPSATGAPWADAVARILGPFDRNPVLDRLEANRIEHLVAGQGRARELEALKKRSARQEAILRKLADSSAFALAERLSGLRQRGAPLFSRAEVRAALAVDDDV